MKIIICTSGGLRSRGKIAVAIVLLCLLTGGQSLAQGKRAEKPVEINLTVGGDGRVDYAGDYILRPDRYYRITVVVDPKDLLNEVLQRIGKKYSRLYAMVDSDSAAYNEQLVTWLGGSPYNLDEVHALAAALLTDNPQSGLRDLPAGAVFSPSAFLLYNLQEVRNSISGTVKIGRGEAKKLRFVLQDGKLVATSEVMKTAAHLDNDLLVVVKSANIENVITQRYYNHVYGQVTFPRWMDTTRIREEYEELLSWQQKYEDFQPTIAAVDDIWSDNDRRRILSLVDSVYSTDLTDNFFLPNNLADGDDLGNWFLRTWWLSGGAVGVNPLPFTDAQHLQLPEEPPIPDDYTTYRTALLNDLISGGLVNDRTNYRLVDSLIRGLDRKYINRKWHGVIDSLKGLNQKIRKEYEYTKVTLQQLTFLVPNLPANYVEQVMVSSQGDRLINENRIPAGLPTQDSLYFVITNVSGNYNPKVTPHAASINDRSQAVEGIVQVGKIASSALAVRAPAGMVVSSLYNAFGESSPQAGRRTISLSRQQLRQLVRTDLSEKYYAVLTERESPVTFLSLSDSAVQQLTQQAFQGLTFSILDVASMQEQFSDSIRHIRLTDVDEDGAPDEPDSLAAVLQRLALISLQQEIAAKFSLQKERIDAAVMLFKTPSSRLLPPAEIRARDVEASAPVYRNITTHQRNDAKAQQHDLTLELIDATGARGAGCRFRYKTSPGHWLSGSIGPTLTTKLEVTEGNSTDDGVTSQTTDNQFGAAVALHYHPWRMVNTNDSFVLAGKLGKWNSRARASRLSLALGVNLRKPLSYPQAGLSVDLWPGVKVIGGVQWYRRNYYQIVNNAISNKDYTYERAGYITLGIDPIGLNDLLNIFK